MLLLITLSLQRTWFMMLAVVIYYAIVNYCSRAAMIYHVVYAKYQVVVYCNPLNKAILWGTFIQWYWLMKGVADYRRKEQLDLRLVASIEFNKIFGYDLLESKFPLAYTNRTGEFWGKEYHTVLVNVFKSWSSELVVKISLMLMFAFVPVDLYLKYKNYLAEPDQSPFSLTFCFQMQASKCPDLDYGHLELKRYSASDCGSPISLSWLM